MTANRIRLDPKTLKDASKVAQRAFEAWSNPNLASVPSEEKTAWAMTAIIHCDMCRLLFTCLEADHEGLLKLLSLTDMVSKLFEAKRWYFEKGSKLLCDIAKNKQCGESVMRDQLSRLRKKIKIGHIEHYSDYRNKFGYHYDSDAIDYLVKFGKEDSQYFFNLVADFVRFSSEWTSLTKKLIQDKIPQAPIAT